MNKYGVKILASILVIFIFFAIFFLNYFKKTYYHADFENNTSDFGPLETLEGVAYPIRDGASVSSEGFSHLRVPYQSSGLAKKLTTNIHYKLDGAKILEVGVRKSSFWLDYDRIPVRNKALDELAFAPRKPWKILEKDGETVFLSPHTTNDFKSFDDFMQNPPDKGLVGLYGNTEYSCPPGRCKTEPFQYWSDPIKYRAIYARYVPVKGNGFINAEILLSLNNAFQNPDGSFDLMFFSYPEEKDGKPVVLVKKIEGKIEPKLINSSEFMNALKQGIKRIIFRETPAL